MIIIIIVLSIAVLVLLFLYFKSMTGSGQTDKNTQLLLKTMPIIAIVYDRELRVLEIINPNNTFSQAYSDQLIGLTLSEIVDKYPVFEDSVLIAMENTKKAIRIGQDTYFSYDIHFEGQIYYFDAKVALLANDRIIIYSHDITKRIVAEREIGNLKNFFQSVLDNLPVGVFVKDINDDFKTLFFNKKFLEFFDYEVQIEDGQIKMLNENSDRSLEVQMEENIMVAESGLPLVIPIQTYNEDGSIQRYGLISKNRCSVSDKYSYIIGTLVDTTNIRKDEIELEERRNEILIALEAGNLTAWSYDIVKKKFSSIYGVTMSGSEYAIDVLFELLHPDSHEIFQNFIDSLVSKELKTATALLCFKVHAGYRWYQSYASGISSEDGTIVQIIGMLKDVTDDLNKQNELIEGKFKLELAMDAAGIVMWDYDAETTKLTSPNPLSIAATNDVTMEDYIGRLVFPEDQQLFRDIVNSLIEDKRDHAEHVIKLRDIEGKIQWAQFTARVLARDRNGKARKIIGTRKYITKSVEATNKLKEANLKTELVFQSNNIVQWDYYIEKDIFISPDPSSVMYGGINSDEYLSIIHDDDKELFLNAIREIEEGRLQKSTVQMRLNTSSGMRWHEIDCVSFKSSDEDEVKVITGLRRDITDWKNMTNELILLRNKAEESNRLKSAFLANMSHEIRTPLNAIVGFSNLITTCDDPVEKDEFSKVIETNNELLLQLINDILDLSKIEAGQLEFVYSEMDVTEMLQHLEQVFRYRAKDGIEIIANIPSDHCYICSEKNRLTQVLFNFLSNACKFTKEGSITMGYEYVEGGLKFYVSDTGKGIAEENFPNVFERFAKFDNFVQGTGLGLSICRTIVTKLNGEIFFESKLGIGSTFWFTIPCDILTEAPNYEYYDEDEEEEDCTIPQNTNKESRKLILIAEDNYSNYVLVSKLLSDSYEIIHANNGVEAIDLHASHRPDLILMDIKMPELNGLEATSAIRGCDKRTPIIALTAHAYNNDREEALLAGCNEFLTKPINKQEMNECLAKYL